MNSYLIKCNFPDFRQYPIDSQKRELYYTKYLKRINNKDIYSLGTASLDRKNSSLDYTKDNIQWVHKDVNYMKMSLSEKYFIKLCKLIARRFQ